MKKTMITLLLLAAITSYGESKKPLDHSVYDSWQSVSDVRISDDGNTVAYVVSPREGDSELHIKKGDTKITIERGSAPTFTEDGKWAVFSIKPQYAKTRNARIKKSKKMPKDSLAIMNLEDFSTKKYPDVNSFTVGTEKDFVVVYGIDDSKIVVVKDTSTTDTLKNVANYSLDRFGKQLAVVHKKDKKDSLSIDKAVLYSLVDKSEILLSENEKWYGSPRFNCECDAVTLLASSDSNKTGSKNCKIIIHKNGTTKEISPKGIPEGQCLNTNSPLYFSKNSDRIFVGISDIIPEDDTTLYDFETAKLDIWNYDQYMTPPIQKMRLSKIKAATRLSVIDLDGDKLIPLAETLTESVRLIDGGESDLAISVDGAPYWLSSSWNDNDSSDVFLVSLKDGSRKTLFKGLGSSPSLSPEGKYLVWYSNRNWYTYNIKSGITKNITEGVDGIFYDDEDDHPCPAPSFGGLNWFEGDKAFLLNEKYDVFKFTPDGRKVINLTNGEGRRNNTQYRTKGIRRSGIPSALSTVGVQKPLSPTDTIFLSVFNRTTKENGYARISASKPGFISDYTATFSYNKVAQAFRSDNIVYLKGNFNSSNDAFLTTDYFRTEERLTAINPQQEDYNWGNIRLVSWKAYDGTPLEGLLITPEDLDTTKSYPMIAYFYEKNSHTLYTHYNPAPSRSVINFPFYASRGYVVFIPDVVYVTGHPGESAYNCICSGVEAMEEQFPFIDSTRVGIQGQSWGGYQTAYLVTRTDMFAAAGSGAPVGNMTSAYGGIRWGTGIFRSSQYEHGQSRIGKSLWDEGGLDLYIENSPIFHTKDVTTPVLIMHNDGDGAVPWYQGIEFFMSLRRFGHPCWLLQYNGEAHNLNQTKNCKDLSRRLQQFFDHYLKGEHMPEWMATGVPMTRKGQYFGFEPAEDYQK